MQFHELVSNSFLCLSSSQEFRSACYSININIDMLPTSVFETILSLAYLDSSFHGMRRTFPFRTILAFLRKYFYVIHIRGQGQGRRFCLSCGREAYQALSTTNQHWDWGYFIFSILYSIPRSQVPSPSRLTIVKIQIQIQTRPGVQQCQAQGLYFVLD